jgi:hypothetical protein
MDVQSSVEAGKHWLVRAKECRKLAETFRDPQTRERMLQVADDYEELAMRSFGRVQPRSNAQALQEE